MLGAYVRSAAVLCHTEWLRSTLHRCQSPKTVAIGRATALGAAQTTHSKSYSRGCQEPVSNSNYSRQNMWVCVYMYMYMYIYTYINIYMYIHMKRERERGERERRERERERERERDGWIDSWTNDRDRGERITLTREPHLEDALHILPLQETL